MISKVGIKKYEKAKTIINGLKLTTESSVVFLLYKLLYTNKQYAMIEVQKSDNMVMGTMSH